jgi:hypothetical protein
LARMPDANEVTRQVVLDCDLLESLVKLFGPMSTKQIERLEKIRAKGRKPGISQRCNARPGWPDGRGD